MELAALRTAQKLLAQRPLLYLEICGEHLARYGAAPAELEALLKGYGYRFFRNVGERNSGHDSFILHAVNSLAEGGSFFRPARNPRRPSAASPCRRPCGRRRHGGEDPNDSFLSTVRPGRSKLRRLRRE